MITIKFGRDNEVRKAATEFTTVGQVLRNASLKSTLGFGDNVEAHVNGAAVGGTFALRDGDIVVLITKANSKGC